MKNTGLILGGAAALGAILLLTKSAETAPAPEPEPTPVPSPSSAMATLTQLWLEGKVKEYGYYTALYDYAGGQSPYDQDTILAMINEWNDYGAFADYNTYVTVYNLMASIRVQ